MSMCRVVLLTGLWGQTWWVGGCCERCLDSPPAGIIGFTFFYTWPASVNDSVPLSHLKLNQCLPVLQRQTASSCFCTKVLHCMTPLYLASVLLSMRHLDQVHRVPQQGYMLGTVVNGTLGCKSGLTVKKYLTF